MSDSNIEFKPGEYFIYVNGDSFELGRVKHKKSEDSYACYYHSGETAAVTPIHCMHKLQNAYCITETDLGGQEAKALFE